MSRWLAYDTCRSRTDSDRNIPTLSRKFDLSVGDKVKINRKADRDGKFWEVTAIYENLFMCKSRYGEKQSFTKREYQLNEVVKVKDFGMEE